MWQELKNKINAALEKIDFISSDFKNKSKFLEERNGIYFMKIKINSEEEVYCAICKELIFKDKKFITKLKVHLIESNLYELGLSVAKISKEINQAIIYDPLAILPKELIIDRKKISFENLNQEEISKISQGVSSIYEEFIWD